MASLLYCRFINDLMCQKVVFKIERLVIRYLLRLQYHCVLTFIETTANPLLDLISFREVSPRNILMSTDLGSYVKMTLPLSSTVHASDAISSTHAQWAADKT